MYSSTQTRDLQLASEALLKSIHRLSGKDIVRLRQVLRFHEYRYYIMDEPLVADVEYDQLFKTLEKIEEEHPELIISSSPTQRVAKGLTKDFPTVVHMVHP